MAENNLESLTAIGEAQTKEHDDEPQPPEGSKLIILILSLCLTQFLSALDTTIISTALPRIARDLHATAAEYTWVAASYTLTSTACTPVWARCSDIAGRKPLLVMAKLIFMGGSVLAALSNSPSMMISGRTLQGLGAGGMQIFCQLIIADIFPLHLRAKYYGYTALVYAVASGLGPILGGIFTQTIGWQWCYYINLPFAGLSLVLLLFSVKLRSPKEDVASTFKTFDWGGSILIVGGTIVFLCGLEGGASRLHSWSSAYTLGLLLSGILAFTGFVLYEWKVPSSPLIPLSVFQGRSKLAILAASFAHTFVFIAYDFFLPLYFQVVLRASPLHSALYLLILIVPMSTVASGTGIFIKNTGKYREPMWFGSMLMTLGTGLFISFGTTTEWPKLVSYQLLAALGAGTMFLSPMIAMQNHLRPEETSAGIAAYTFLRSLGSSISIVCGGVVLQAAIHSNGIATIPAGTEGSQPTFSEVLRYTSGLSKLWVFYTGICGLMLLSVLLVGPSPANNSSVEDVEKSSH